MNAVKPPMVARIVGACARHAWTVAAIGLLLAIACATYTVRHFAIDTETAKLISPELHWRQREIAFDAAFPQRADLIAVVVDGATPELAERAASSLTVSLSSDKQHFRSVRRPDGGAYFDQEGLLFLPLPELGETLQRLIDAEPLLAMLAADPTLRGLMDALSTMMKGVARDASAAAKLAGPLGRLADAFESIAARKPTFFSWRRLFDDRAPDPRELRRFILVQPVLDFSALQPGAAASETIRTTANDLGLTSSAGVTVRLTGPVPLGDEEFATLEEGAAENAAALVVSLVVLLWLALRSGRLVVAVIVTLFAGLCITAACGLAVFGRFNLISVAFAVLFVGLGVDFGIQLCVAYRAKRVADDQHVALERAASEVGGALALAATSTAIGFYAFVPTDYGGVSELGVIAGTGMLIAFAASVTLLPALIAILRPRRERRRVGIAPLAPLDDLILRRRRGIVALAAVVGIASSAALPRLTFDFNPLNLRSPHTESVATLYDLARDPATTPNTIDLLAPSLSAANALAERIAALPEVDHAITLADLVPQGQDDKLALIADAALLLDPVLNPAGEKPPPSDADVVAAMRAAAQSLRDSAPVPSPLREAATRLSAALQRLAAGDPELRHAARDALVPGLVTMLAQLRAGFSAQHVTFENVPPEIARDWVATDGRARVEVYPAGDANDNPTLARFVDAVRRIAPDAVGAPVSIQESGRTIVQAFRQAGLWAAVGILVVLIVTLRDLQSVLLTLAPLVLAALATLAICAIAGFALNFENIIALPLLFGIGVAFDIYFVVAWRAGSTHLLASSLSRAVLFSALTTGTAFGSLWLSHHPGTSSMGKLLALSLAMTLVSVLVFLPALLRSLRPSRLSTSEH